MFRPIMSDAIAIGQHWQHKKRGSVYEIVDTDAAIQISALTADKSAMLEAQDWIAYRNIAGGKLVFRMREEFLDGRFERVA
jgi:hypothetical protein